MASTVAKMHQDSASSVAPHAKASVPNGVPESRCSKMIRASIGNAVVAMDAPRNIIAMMSVTLFSK